jgi:hypothetical protein
MVGCFKLTVSIRMKRGEYLFGLPPKRSFITVETLEGTAICFGQPQEGVR